MYSEKPLISITMATHNRADLLLRRSVPSVLRQTYDNWELLVRGDGAGKDTEFVIDSFNDSRIKYKRLPRRLYSSPNEQWAVGGAAALNDALDEAQGDYIAHLDDDDELLPNHLYALMALLRSGDFDFVWGRTHYETNGGWIVFGKPPDVAQLQHENLMVHSAVMYDRRKFGQLRYDIEGSEPADWRMWKKIATAGARLGFVDQIVAIHYVEAPHRQPWLKFTHGRPDLWKTLRARTIGLKAPAREGSRNRLASVKVMINVGSGLKHRLGPNWKNLDILRGADIRADVRNGLPFEDGSVDFIYSEHFVEHMSLDEAGFYFNECFRVLKRGGVVRTATIDLRYILERYAQDWPDQTWVRDYSFETASEMINAVFYMWGHKFIHDEETLKRSMVKGGFQVIERCGLGRSRHPELVNLETRPESRLILEGVQG